MHHRSSSDNDLTKASHESDFHVRWVWLSKWIVRGGGILGALANLTLGREFTTSDPVIGPILLPFMVAWVLAFSHYLYTRLRGQLSAPVKWLGLGTIALFASILVWVMFSGDGNQPKNQTNGEQSAASDSDKPTN